MWVVMAQGISPCSFKVTVGMMTLPPSGFAKRYASSLKANMEILAVSCSWRLVDSMIGHTLHQAVQTRLASAWCDCSQTCVTVHCVQLITEKDVLAG